MASERRVPDDVVLLWYSATPQNVVEPRHLGHATVVVPPRCSDAIEKISSSRVTHCLKVDRIVLFVIEVGDMVILGFLDF